MLKLMLARLYSDVAEQQVDKNDLLANISFIYRCLSRPGVDIGQKTGSKPVVVEQQDGVTPSQGIENILQAHAQTSIFDESSGTASLNIGTTFPDLHINGEVVPSLQQARSDKDHSNFCGYFALNNALGFLQPSDVIRLDRAQFIQLFGNCLQDIQRYAVTVTMAI